MSAEPGLYYCYNKGCGQKFDPSLNNEESCLYHPGSPYFHDAYKIWNCCNKKSTDFATWLSFPGCTKGNHNAQKPSEADARSVKNETRIRPEIADEVVVWNGLNKPAARNIVPRDMLCLQFNIMPGLESSIVNDAKPDAEEVEFGSSCRNSGCSAVYNSAANSGEVCIYHSGDAVFHEGLKFWSCCEKKTSNFGAFIEQKGCTVGKHNWSKAENLTKLREDWFCRSGKVYLNLYCKGVLPERCRVMSDGLVLDVKIVYAFGLKDSEHHYDLFEEIDIEQSVVNFGERKIEIVLKQVLGGNKSDSWPRLTCDES